MCTALCVCVFVCVCLCVCVLRDLHGLHGLNAHIQFVFILAWSSRCENVVHLPLELSNGCNRGRWSWGVEGGGGMSGGSLAHHWQRPKTLYKPFTLQVIIL